MVRIDLNADLGEVPGDLALMRVVSSANVACGGHAGDDDSMSAAMAEARSHGVVVGAHPSYPDRENFGRLERNDPADVVADAVAEQVGRLARLGPVSYVKLHGALYHRANNDEEVAAAIADVLPVQHVLAQPGFLLEEALRRGWGATVEGFCDRAYREDGSLVPRDEEGAVLTGASEVVAQAVRLAGGGRVRSLCVHGDTPGALELAERVRSELTSAGFEVAPFA